MEDISKTSKQIGLDVITAKIIHIEAMLAISLRNQAQIIANQENKDFKKLFDAILKDVQKESNDIFLNLPS